MIRALWLLLAVMSGTACAQTYPAKALTLVAPSTPGSAPDVLARVMAQKLSEQLGQQVVVINRPGAGTNIGTLAVAQAAPDGYSLLLGSIANTINPHVMRSVGYRIEDFAAISSVAAAPDVLVVHPSVPASSVAELIALLKAKPGTPAGHAGIGTTPHLSLEMFRRAAGVEVTPVPFKGGGEAQQGILGGQVPFMFSTTIGILPRVRSGQVRGLAVSSAKRIAAAPELPTVAESGVPGYEVTSWNGMLIPAGTPPEIVKRYNAEFNKAITAPDMRKRMIENGYEPVGGEPEKLSELIRVETAKWAKVVKATGMKVD